MLISHLIRFDQVYGDNIESGVTNYLQRNFRSRKTHVLEPYHNKVQVIFIEKIANNRVEDDGCLVFDYLVKNQLLQNNFLLRHTA